MKWHLFETISFDSLSCYRRVCFFYVNVYVYEGDNHYSIAWIIVSSNISMDSEQS